MKDNVDYNKNDSINNIKQENVTQSHSEYESFNIVSENGDSIYSIPTSYDGTVEKRSGQVYALISEIRKIVNEELDKRLGLK